MHDAEVGAGGCLVRRLDDEHLRSDAHQPLGVADLRERLGDRGRGAEHDDLGRHQRAGGALVVGEQAPHHIGVLVVHRLEDAGALFARHLGEEVGEIVVLHLLEHADQPIEVETFDHAQLLRLGQLLEQVGESFVVHRRSEQLAVRERERANDGGDVARVHVAQAGGFGRHLTAGLHAEQVGHLVAVEEAVAGTAPERSAAGEPDLRDVPPRLTTVTGRLQRHVAHRLVAHATVDEVTADEDLPGLRLERIEVDVPAAQPCAVAVEGADAPGVHEDPAALAHGDEAQYSRRAARLAGDDHDVLEPTDGRPTGVE